MTPAEILVNARESRDWTTYDAAKRAGIGDQQLRNLEGGATDPTRVSVLTLLALVAVYWPDIQLSDLIPGALFRLEPRSPAVTGVLIARSSSEGLHRAMRREVRTLASDS